MLPLIILIYPGFIILRGLLLELVRLDALLESPIVVNCLLLSTLKMLTLSHWLSPPIGRLLVCFCCDYIIRHSYLLDYCITLRCFLPANHNSNVSDLKVSPS